MTDPAPPLPPAAGAANRLSILQLTQVDSQTGAGRIAWGLHEELAARGHGSRMVVGHKKSTDPAVREIWDRPLNNLASRLVGRNLRRTLHRKVWPWLANDIAWLPGRHLLRWPEFLGADLVHAHTLHSGFFNLRSLPSLARRKPWVWTLHDMWALTAYQIYSACSHWPGTPCMCEGASALPRLRWDNSRHLWSMRQRIYRSTKLTLVVPSRWLRDQVRRSMLADKDVHLIYNGVDTDLFRPRHRAESRQRLGLPQDGTVALFVGKRGNFERKGGSFFGQLLESPESAGARFVTVGGVGGGGSNWHSLPHLTDAAEMAAVYGACDVLVYPTLDDNCPLVVLEAMASGLPVLAFAVGGVPELVEDGVTGWMTPARDGEAFASRFGAFLELGAEARQAVAAAARRRAVERFSLDEMVESYIALYREVLAGTSSSARSA